MKILQLFFLLTLSFGWSSFQPAGIDLDKVIGIWIPDEDYQGGEKYIKASAFEEDKEGFEFKKDGSAIYRNSGWCGTPPLSFYNEARNWSLILPNIIRIYPEKEMKGSRVLQYKIEKVTATELYLKYLGRCTE